MLPMLLGTAGCLIGLIGWYGFGSAVMLAAGTGLIVTDLVMGLTTGELRTISTDAAAAVIGTVISVLTGGQLLTGAMIGLCIWSAALALLNIPAVIIAIVRQQKE